MARVLVMDDDDQIRTALRQVLELDGYDVLEAPDGKEGMRTFREQGARHYRHCYAGTARH